MTLEPLPSERCRSTELIQEAIPEAGSGGPGGRAWRRLIQFPASLLEMTAKISLAWGPSDPVTSQVSLGQFFSFSFVLFCFCVFHMSNVDDISEQFGADVSGTKEEKEELQMGRFCFHFFPQNLITT